MGPGCFSIYRLRSVFYREENKEGRERERERERDRERETDR